MAENMAVYDVISRNYGKINLTLKAKMNELRVTRHRLSKLSGTSYNVITNYYNNKMERVDLDVLARVCFVLGCEISDILEYEKP